MSVDPKINILLVEDSGIMRKMQVKTLQQLGFETIVEAVDGKDAIEKLTSGGQPVDLVISDWNMPNMSGYELVSWMRANDACKEIPFIMATAQSDRGQENKARDAGVTTFVPKPFSPDELQSKINAAMAQDEEPAEETEDRGPDMTDDGRVILKMAHIQITDHIILGVLRHMIGSGQVKPAHFVLETRRMPGWNPVRESLENGDVSGAFVLAPIAMDAFAYGAPIKMVMLAHKNGSIFVRSKKGDYRAPYENFFRNKTFYLPHTLSVHNMLSHMFFKKMGLRPGVPGKEEIDVQFEVVPPIKMPEFLAQNDNACGFMVAEPLGTKAIAAGAAELQFLSSELWPDHPCCVVAMRDEYIENHPDALHEFTSLLVKAGKFVEEQPGQAAEIAVAFLDPDGSLGLKAAVLKNVLTEPKGIRTGDLFPVKEDFERIQQYMTEQMGIGQAIDVDKFLDLRFAEEACRDSIKSKPKAASVALDVSADIMERRRSEQAAKAMLGKEGKYLTFKMGKEEYGIELLKIREIIGMMPITKIPKSPRYVKGVIDLRGKVIPVLDLRLKFGLEERKYNDRTCIIVLEFTRKSGVFNIGIVVDAVSEVLTIKSEDVDGAPVFGSKINTDFILGMAKVGGDVKILLDIEEALGSSARPLDLAA